MICTTSEKEARKLASTGSGARGGGGGGAGKDGRRNEEREMSFSADGQKKTGHYDSVAQ